METGKRTLVKMIIWQAVGVITMSIVGFAITGSLVSGGVLALANTGVGIVTYVTYERIWSRINWGRHA
ncbi:MAG: DUF2061 domain-containing protein [Paracoccaceae bacterium]|jgi:uncharacterized membrane protein